MKKLSHAAYRALFFKHSWRFLQSVLKPFELKKNHVVAVSGGLDSMTLLWFACSLHRQGKIGAVRAVFIHHHTRAGQDQDEKLVRDWCVRENIPFKSLHAQGLGEFPSNFELRARVKRRELLKGDLDKNELLWQGHHLNDSFEWHLMQKFRSSNVKANLGIPVRNGPIVRPFLCVSRKQIRRVAEGSGLQYNEDPTNQDTHFERNYIRHEVIATILTRYPQALKHYVHTVNFAAMLLKLNIVDSGGVGRVYAYEKGAILLGHHFNEVQIQELLHAYSNTDRGEIVGPIQRMIKAIDNEKKGPFMFSGGMEAYHTPNLLMFYPQGMTNYDGSIATLLAQMTDAQLKEMVSEYKRAEFQRSWDNFVASSDAILNMPGLVLVLESESICKTLNTSVFDPLFPRVSEVCKARGLRFVYFQKCLETWERKKQKLPEKLKLLPLCNLSNLFSSHH